MGEGAMIASTTASRNTAVGVSALRNNTTGFGNIAIGQDACNANQSANSNTGVGWSALTNNTGSTNTAVGSVALANNTTGHDNTAEGFEALANNKSGSSNIALGSGAAINLTTGSNNIDIGAPGVAAEANTIRIGKSGTQKKTLIAGIRGVTVASGVGVIVGTTGQLGTIVSSARFKDDIKPMDKASEALLKLKPVTFRYKEELDPDKIPQFGLVAEEVEKVNPDLVARDEDGNVMTVRYEAVNAMLLNEFLKEHRRVQEQEQKLQKQEATIVRQQKDFESKFAQQHKQIEVLTAGLQKVTARVEAANSVQRVVSDN
jgi:Chaperone of endosialidase